MATKGGRNRRLPRLEQRFEFEDEAVVAGSQEAFRSSIYRVVDKDTGADRALRVWKKTGTSADRDLRELWVHERRQVQRLMATAGGSGVIVDVLEFLEDDQELAVVLEDAGQPLSQLRERSKPHHWLRNLGLARNRVLLWRNCARIAQAISMLHAQGLIHGHLGADVIMTYGGQVPDFKLTGFEWSLWFAAPSEAHRRARVARSDDSASVPYSFAMDWNRLGTMMANLLGLTIAGDGGVVPSGQSVDTMGGERALISRLVSPARTEALDVGSILRAIGDVVSGLERDGGVRGGTFILIVPDTSGIGEAAARATAGEIDPGDSLAHISWAQADLNNGATLLVPADTGRSQRPPVLVTQLMRYHLKPGEIPGDEPTWNLAYCTSARLREGNMGPDWRVETHPVTQPVNVVGVPRQARELRARLGTAALDWAAFFDKADVVEADDGVSVRRSLILVQAVEGVIRALDALPVEVLETRSVPGGCRVAVRARSNTERDKIARALGILDTVDSLQRMFAEDRREGEEGWTLGPTDALGDNRRADQIATFVGMMTLKGVDAYGFELDAEPEISTNLFIRSRQNVGTERVLARRLRNIAALVEQPGLASMLNAPWSVRRSVADDLEEDAAFHALDKAKQDAIHGIWSTSPLYCVVGPPGVGKTHLGTEVVRRRLTVDGSTRLLLTAQGHDALDNLQDAVDKMLTRDFAGSPLMVRVTSQQRPDREGDSLRQVATLLANLVQSDESAHWPPPFRNKMVELAKLADTEAKRNGPGLRRISAGTRSTAALLLDAANVVVATTNSSDIERMVMERAQFDAVVVEEAAKATGPELVGALALSGRRLLIGDHNQLPSFGADQFERILGDHSLSASVIEAAERLVGPLFSEGELLDLRDASNVVGGLENVRGLAYRLVQFFRTVVVGDETRKAGNPHHRALSTYLYEQRRMHPALAELVSRPFYEGKLRTAKERELSAYSKHLPFECAMPLPESPLVVVDFDHVMRTGNARKVELDRKAWHNPDEVNTVLDVLRLLRLHGTDGPPTLAVLSPYSAQVDLLRTKIAGARTSGRLPSLDGFRAARDGLDIVGTVDSFQGAEADIVVVSLVRNNPNVGARALGFLRDRRRMNVLLSRAKAKLVLVTSLGFLSEAVEGAPAAQREDLAFIRTILSTIDELKERRGPDGIPLATVVHPADLRTHR